MRLSPLRDPIDPDPRESLRGVIVRALAAGGVPRTWTITRHLGIPYPGQTDFAESEFLDVPELARIIKAPLSELEARRRPAVGAGRRSFHGMIMLNAFETKRRRFAPAALEQGAFSRDIWELKALPFCHMTFQMLGDTCRCDKVQGWTRPNGVARCDDCGRDLRLTPAAAVPEAMRDVIALPALLASPIEADRAKAVEMLPKPLREVDRSILYDVVIRLRAALWDGEGSVERDLASMHAASTALVDWPNGLRRAQPGTGLSAQTWTDTRNLYMDLVHGERIHPASSAERRATVTPAPTARRGTRRLPASAIPNLTKREASTSVLPVRIAMPALSANREARRDLVGIDLAAKAARISPAILARACDATEIKAVEHWHGSKLVLRVRQRDVDAFAKAYYASLPLDTVGARLGVHPASVMQLVSAEILPTRGPRLQGGGPRVMMSDLEEFEAGLIGAQSQTVDNPVPIYRAIFAVGARPKPWAAIIAAMLNGDLPFNIRSRETGGYDTRARFGSTPIYQAVIPADMVARIAEMPDGTDADWWSPPTTTLTKLEACEILNLTPNTDALDGVSKTDEFFSRLDRSEVMALAQRAIGVGEIAFRCGWKAGFGHRLLRELGVPSLGHALWCRATVETMLIAGRF